MACINMFNNEQQAFCNGSMGPRISFSNDFADSKQSIHHENNNYREAPVSSDFEFSISGNNLIIPADEVFSKGKLMPLKKEINSTKVVTLRDELLAGEDDDCCDDIFNYRPLKNSGWWKEKLGLKRNQIGSKKGDHKNFGGLETIDEARKPVFANDMFANIGAS